MSFISRKLTIMAVTLVIATSLVLVGCSSKPNEAELKQLQDLKNEVAQLEKDIQAKEQQIASLEQQIAAQTAKFKKITDDQEIVKQRLAK
jgi:outer membrane murein-binding lipoprotein Lpp